jgi:hypothetical protein
MILCDVCYCIVLHCSILYCIVLYCSVLHCPVLHCSTLPPGTNPFAIIIIIIIHNEELCDLYRSDGVVRVGKCGRLEWAGYVAGMDVT